MSKKGKKQKKGYLAFEILHQYSSMTGHELGFTATLDDAERICKIHTESECYIRVYNGSQVESLRFYDHTTFTSIQI